LEKNNKDNVSQFASQGENESHVNQIVQNGTHIGTILYIENNVVTQKAGRSDSEAVLHDLRCLPRKPEIGKVAEIKYQNGIGIVNEKTSVLER
jgi:hypothetical protein